MAVTYEPLATTTLGSAASNIEFTSIPGTYTDLRIILVGTVTTGDSAGFQINSDTGSNYSRTVLQGDGASAASSRNSNSSQIFITRDDISTSSPQLFEVDIFSYAGSTNKTCLIKSSQDKNGSGVVVVTVGLWRSTSAITSLKFFPSTGGNTFKTGTTATLYGILKA